MPLSPWFPQHPCGNGVGGLSLSSLPPSPAPQYPSFPWCQASQRNPEGVEVSFWSPDLPQGQRGGRECHLFWQDSQLGACQVLMREPSSPPLPDVLPGASSWLPGSRTHCVLLSLGGAVDVNLARRRGSTAGGLEGCHSSTVFLPGCPSYTVSLCSMHWEAGLGNKVRGPCVLPTHPRPALCLGTDCCFLSPLGPARCQLAPSLWLGLTEHSPSGYLS